MSVRSLPRPVVRFPKVDGDPLAQDREWCEVLVDGRRRRMRFHDYDEIFSIPGLYEEIFYEHLRCTSPSVISELLAEELEREGVDPASLRGIDVGAGNGMVGEELQRIGVPTLVGVDLIEEAAEAAERDRPGVYVDYVVCDLTDLRDDERERLEAIRPNLLTTVAALGFGDIPPEAFATAFDMLEDGAWVAFNIKADFLEDSDPTGFSKLVQEMLSAGTLDERVRRRYNHRLSMSGDALPYVALIGVKRGQSGVG